MQSYPGRKPFFIVSMVSDNRRLALASSDHFLVSSTTIVATLLTVATAPSLNPVAESNRVLPAVTGARVHPRMPRKPEVCWWSWSTGWRWDSPCAPVKMIIQSLELPVVSLQLPFQLRKVFHKPLPVLQCFLKPFFVLHGWEL